MTVFITGATGLVGQKLVKTLKDKGQKLTIISRNIQSAKSILGEGLNFIEWDFSKGNFDTKDFTNQDTIINLAGENIANMRWSDEQKKVLYNSRVMTTRLICESLENSNKKVKTFINASAIGIYGNRGQEFLTESSPIGAGFLGNLCDDWETELKRAQNVANRQVFMRIGVVLSKEGGALLKMLTPFKLGLGGCIGDGAQWMSWIHIDDLVNLFVNAVENESLTGAVNCVSPYPVQNKKFTKVLCKTLKRPKLFCIPPITLKLSMGEMSSIVLDSQKVVSEKLPGLGFEFKYSKIENALKNLLNG